MAKVNVWANDLFSGSTSVKYETELVGVEDPNRWWCSVRPWCWWPLWLVN